MRKLIGLVAVLGLVGGCSTMLSGAGEMGMGYRSETKVFVFHTVDGDKEESDSKAEVDVTPLMEFLERRAENALADPQ